MADKVNYNKQGQLKWVKLPRISSNVGIQEVFVYPDRNLEDNFPSMPARPASAHLSSSSTTAFHPRSLSDPQAGDPSLPESGFLSRFQCGSVVGRGFFRAGRDRLSLEGNKGESRGGRRRCCKSRDEGTWADGTRTPRRGSEGRTSYWERPRRSPATVHRTLSATWLAIRQLVTVGSFKTLLHHFKFEDSIASSQVQDAIASFQVPQIRPGRRRYEPHVQVELGLPHPPSPLVPMLYVVFTKGLRPRTSPLTALMDTLCKHV
ncbi:hypothetical protein JHW43_000137 [Diplocarpon mali]|nr:hypothetical protein JHW43_000137 [Diplocarpon mali]